jgi:DNA-binding MarR family transcriptional regulator
MWTLFTNHGKALIYLNEHPTALLREIAEAIGVTERAAHTIVSELAEAGYVSRQRVGRRNHYTIHPEAPLRSRNLRDYTLGDMLAGMNRNRSRRLHDTPEACAASH